MKKRYCIVGGGMLGLTLAYRLARSGCDITLHEAAPVLGGLASVWQIGDVEWDRHYHVILASDVSLRSLLTDLGLESKTKWVATRTGFFIDGKLYPFTSPADFFQFPALGSIDKLRLLATISLNALRTEAGSLEDINVSEYLRRSSGRRVFEKFWLPLLQSKLGDNYQHASASFIWATIRRLTAARRLGIQEQFGYVSGGYRTVLNSLALALRQAGVKVYVSSPVSVVAAVGGSVRVCSSENQEDLFDKAIVTTPGPVATAQCSQLTAAEKESWSKIRYQGIICASLLAGRPLGQNYVTNICDSRVPFTGVIEMSTLVPRQEFGNRCLIYLPKYVDPKDPMFEWPDDRIRNSFISGLRLMYGDFEESEVEAFRISRVRHVFAIPTLRYSSNLPPTETSVPGIHIINSAHIVNGTLNVNEVVQLADKAALTLAA